MARKTKKADPGRWAEQHDKARAMADAMISPSEENSRWTEAARRIITAHFLRMQQEGGLVLKDPREEHEPEVAPFIPQPPKTPSRRRKAPGRG